MSVSIRSAVEQQYGATSELSTLVTQTANAADNVARCISGT
ncbi:MAG: hypothetical protein R3C20_04695 [Planctomycetaceae bacterium]